VPIAAQDLEPDSTADGHAALLVMHRGQMHTMPWVAWVAWVPYTEHHIRRWSSDHTNGNAQRGHASAVRAGRAC
jgi:hypothetical protein